MIANGRQSTISEDAARRIAAIRQALESVTDPELPIINVVELGIIADVRVGEDGAEVDMTPTFAGCPALHVMREDIRAAVAATGEDHVTVNVVFDPPWTTERMTEGCREKLKAFGLAPPGRSCGQTQMPDLTVTPCPYCDSTETDLESIFGPTLCRSMHYCRSCQQSFEHFKTV